MTYAKLGDTTTFQGGYDAEKEGKKKKNKKGMTTGKRKTKCVRIHKSQEKTIFRRMAS